MQTYYDILQVTPDASEEVIKAAYKSLVKKYHPDSGIEKDSSKFLKIEEAYVTLVDEQKRRAYDEMLARQAQADSEKSESRASSAVSKPEDGPPGDSGGHEEKQKPDRSGNFFSGLFTLIFWGFVIACFVTNMEQYRMQLYNMIGKYEFNSEPGNYDVCIHVTYENALLKKTPKVWLNVDGQRVQVLKEGDTYDYECKLSAGKHIVFVETKTLHINSDVYTITVLPESESTYVRCIVTGKWLGGGADFTVEGTLH